MSVATRNKELLIESASRAFDGVLVSLRFHRPSRSLTYTRRFPAAHQELRLAFDSSPRYAPDSSMHLLPAVNVSMPEVGEIASGMVGGNASLLGNAPGLMAAHQIQNLAPPGQYPRWLVSDATTCQRSLQSIAECFTRWAEPFLQDYSSPDSLLRQYEAGDQRPIQSHSYFIRVAACYLERGKRELAAGVLDRHLGKPGLRKMYARAFQFIAEPDAPPNGGPSMQLGNSGITEGPPSVS
jgi:hypothetical protein